MVGGVAAPAGGGTARGAGLVDAGREAEVGAAAAVCGRREGSCGRSDGDGEGGGSGAGGGRAGAGRGIADGAVPVLLGVAEALSDSDGLEAVAEKGLEHVVCQVVDGLVDRIVLDLQPLGVGGVLAFHVVIPDVLGVLNELWAVMKVALSVQVEVGDVVAKVIQVAFTSGVTGGVRGSIDVSQVFIAERKL